MYDDHEYRRFVELRPNQFVVTLSWFGIVRWGLSLLGALTLILIVFQ